MSLSESMASATRPDPTTGPSRLRQAIAEARIVIRQLVPIVTGGLAVWAIMTQLPHVTMAGRMALAIFALAVIGWTMTRIGDATIAFLAVFALVAAGLLTQDQVQAVLGGDLTWLIACSFVMAAVLRETGLARALSLPLIRKARHVPLLFRNMTLLIAATAFVIPSTSGRAALLLPVFVALADALDNARLTRALALLFPTVILLSAGGSLIGAGAHLIAVDTMRAAGAGDVPGFLGWALLALPVSLVSCLVASRLIQSVFLTRAERQLALDLADVPVEAPSLQANRAGLIALVAVGLWATERWHGMAMAHVALVAAILMTIPAVTGVKLKTALKAVEWELVLFLAATLAMGQALIASGAVSDLVRLVSGLRAGDGILRVEHIAVLIVGVAMVSHLLITSRSARAAVLLPALAMPLAGAGYDPVAVALLLTLGTGYCQTLMASAKPVALFGNLDRPTYSAGDLALLSLLLAPVMGLLLVGTALYVWPWQGATLVAGMS
jgi:di/tricarboxylate transporter